MASININACFIGDDQKPHINHEYIIPTPLEGIQQILNVFAGGMCLFLRIDAIDSTLIYLDGHFAIKKCTAGGWMLLSQDTAMPNYWLPAPATLRRINTEKQIQEEHTADWGDFDLDANRTTIAYPAISEKALLLDIVIWKLDDPALTQELTRFNPLESQGYFLLGSHDRILQPADLYRHLIHGSVYDLRYAWPHKKKCFSENEAHALYLIFSGLEKNTGKSIYRYLQQQLVLSITHRQAEDGGWYHGMWTDASECHYRLHTSAVHLLLDEFSRTGCPQIKTSLEKGVSFLAKNTVQLDCGIWFLHDSLELSERAMNSGPFKWIPNNSLGKSTSNMLVLNTHLDSTIAINRYAQITGDQQYDALISSAQQSTCTVLALKPAEWLYKPLFWAISLTMLPTEQASRLSLPLRAIKRFAAEYLIKKLPDIKAKFPRIVMPNGYIDRELSLRTWAIDYQTINLMDLARYDRAFPGKLEASILNNALAFTHDIGLVQRYRELPAGKRYAPGFWMEALYHRCLAKQDLIYRQWLAEAILVGFETGLGIAPSLLGCNGEAVAYKDQVKMPLLNNSEIIIANLSQSPRTELVLVNTSENNIILSWCRATPDNLTWFDSKGNQLLTESLSINSRDWIFGKQG